MKNKKKINLNKKILIPIIAVLVALIAIICVFVFIKGSVSEFSGKEENDTNAGISNGDKGYISSAQIIQTKTGTGPWDANDDPGNDSSEDNNIVRSFDQITWTVDLTMALKDGVAETGLIGGVINVELSIPEKLSNLVTWDVDSMTWADGTGKVSEDGRIFTGQYKLSDEIVTIPGKQALNFILKVENATNGMQIQPTFKVWLEGNETDSSSPNYEVVEVRTQEPITVSSKVGFNLKLVQASRETPKVSVDFGDGNGNVEGRMYGFGVVVQLYNKDTSKGLKGLEYPKGDVSFDVDMTFWKITNINDNMNMEDITSSVTPQLWNYKINIGDIYGRNNTVGEIANRNMHFGNYTSYDDSKMPYGMKRENSSRPEGEIYNSGKVMMAQNGGKLNVNISDYEINGIFPKYNDYYISSTTVQYGDNIGCFSDIFFQIFIPTNLESSDEILYGLEVQDNNMTISSESGEVVTEQERTNDDYVALQHVNELEGNYYQGISLTDINNNAFNNDPEVSNQRKGKSRNWTRIYC